ncbi:hypothetical protein [Ottowia thiooxydans]|uniref:hypothetical protein n=1 Tax=Ottowia thiooxydans TaxID=219182 RepID=UPI00042688E1|nr:hypothetical protein [Ottowia thiooxydans]
MIYINPPPEIVPETVKVLGISTTDEILFSAHASEARSAEEITTVAFDQSVLSVDGKQLRLEGLATIQNSRSAGMLIVRSKFTVLKS